MDHFVRQYFLRFLCLMSCVSLCNCAASTLKVESQPEGADVYVSVPGQTARKIGVTPLAIAESQVNSGTDAFQISVMKDGFATENILSPSTVFSRATSVQVRLKESGSTKQTLNDELLQKLTSQVAYTQNQIRAKDYDGAERTLSSLMPQFPNVATLHELLGNVYYLKKELNKAHASYKRALDLNPANTDTLHMIQKIENIRSDLRAKNATEGSK